MTFDALDGGSQVQRLGFFERVHRQHDDHSAVFFHLPQALAVVAERV